MNKQNPSKQDRWIIGRWEDALQFEEAMASARRYYERLFEKVHEVVRKKYPSLQECEIKCLRDKLPGWAWEDGGGCVGFTHPTWYSAMPRWPTGIWISNISLDELSGKPSSAPNVSIWLSLERSNRRKIDKLRERLLARVRKDRGCRAMGFQTCKQEDEETCLYYDLPEKPTDLLRMALQDGGQPFVSCISQHVQRMATLLRGLDDLLR